MNDENDDDLHPTGGGQTVRFEGTDYDYFHNIVSMIVTFTNPNTKQKYSYKFKGPSAASDNAEFEISEDERRRILRQAIDQNKLD